MEVENSTARRSNMEGKVLESDKGLGGTPRGGAQYGSLEAEQGA